MVIGVNEQKHQELLREGYIIVNGLRRIKFNYSVISKNLPEIKTICIALLICGNDYSSVLILKSLRQKMKNLTEDDIYMLKYLWQEKEDITCYNDFEKIKPILIEKYPEVLKAWNDYQTSIRMMNSVINSLTIDYYESL